MERRLAIGDDAWRDGAAMLKNGAAAVAANERQKD